MTIYMLVVAYKISTWQIQGYLSVVSSSTFTIELSSARQQEALGALAGNYLVQSTETNALQSGGQDWVNLSKPGKLCWGPKSDLAGSCQQSAGHKKHIALKTAVEGFRKTLENSRNIGVWLWPKKVYTWLTLVYKDQIVVYSLFAHGETQNCNMELLPKNRVVFITAIVSGALNNWRPKTLTR
jgi:hypothetical protein